MVTLYGGFLEFVVTRFPILVVTIFLLSPMNTYQSPVRVPYRTYGAVLVPRFGIFDLSRFYSTNSPRISRDENYYV